jgi:7-cyano-7-deazaguanine tRNA-ribosyltransferase
VTFEEIRVVKQAIQEGSLWELVENRCRAHPQLLSGLKRALSQHSGWIETIQPLSRSTFFYSGPESSLRPEVSRHRNKLKNFDLNGKVLIRTRRLVNEGEFDWVFDFKPPFGPYPLELKETFPFNAEVVDEPDHESLTVALANLIELMKLNPDCEFITALEGFSGHPKMMEVRKLSSKY